MDLSKPMPSDHDDDTASEETDDENARQAFAAWVKLNQEAAKRAKARPRRRSRRRVER